LPRGALGQAVADWERVRSYYAGFESPMRAGASEVHEHEMPGGQYTNLRQRAHALGVEGRWREVARAYAEVNRMLGDVVKVTPMWGVVVSLSVAVGQRVARGDRLATIEAMKMETAVFAELDGVVEEVVGAVGTRVDADDLLLVVRAPGD
jgi:pyruvate carboxylase